MIVSFGDAATADIFHGRITARVRRFSADLVDRAVVKMDVINAAAKIEDLKIPPGNKFKLLKGDLQGKCEIRINDQFRIIFRWEDGDAFEVQIADIH